MSQSPVDDLGSPDAPEAVTPDLLQDLSEQDMLDLAVEHIQSRMPEWTPRAGSQEVVLVEAMVMLLTSTNFSISMVHTRVVEHLLRLQGITRDQGGPARAMVTFEVAGSQSVYEIPAGTTVRAHLQDTGESVDFTTDGRVEILTGEEMTGEVQVTATEPGRQFNGIPVGTSLDMVDNLPFVERVTLSSASAGGRDPESDAALEARAASRFGRMVTTLVMPDHFKLATLELPNVGRAHVVNAYDPTNSESSPGEDAGHITVAVADNEGQPLTESERGEIEWFLAEQAIASMIIHVVDPDYTNVSVSVEVQAEPTSDSATVKEAVEARLARWLSPAQWAWGGTIRQFDIVTEINRVSGVERVISVNEDLALTGVAPLPRVDDITVTVQQGSA